MAHLADPAAHGPDDRERANHADRDIAHQAEEEQRHSEGENHWPGRRLRQLDQAPRHLDFFRVRLERLLWRPSADAGRGPPAGAAIPSTDGRWRRRARAAALT